MTEQFNETKQCCAEVHNSDRWSRCKPCTRKATIERDGKWYCKQHDPEAVKARREASDAKYKAQYKAIDDAHKRRLAEEAACRNVPTADLREGMVRELLDSRQSLGDGAAELTRERDELRHQLARSKSHYDQAVIDWREQRDANATLKAENERLTNENTEFKIALNAIATSPHQNYETTAHSGDRQYMIGIADGHRCAGNMARLALYGESAARQAMEGGAK